MTSRSLLIVVALALSLLVWRSLRLDSAPPPVEVAPPERIDRDSLDRGPIAARESGRRSAVELPEIAASDEAVATPPVRLEFVDWWTRRPAFAGTHWELTDGVSSLPFTVGEDHGASVEVTRGRWTLVPERDDLVPLPAELDLEPGRRRLVLVVRRRALVVYVRDDRGNPLEGAAVRWWPPGTLEDGGIRSAGPAFTDAEGIARLAGVPTPRAGTLRISRSGFFPSEVSSAAVCRERDGDDSIVADVALSAYDASGAATLVLATSPESGWVDRANASWDLHGFFHGDERWGGVDTVLVGSAKLGEGVLVPTSLQHARRWQFVLSEHQFDWGVEGNAPLRPGETRTVTLPERVDLMLEVTGLDDESGSRVVHAQIPAAGSRPRLGWSRWNERIASKRSVLGAPDGAALDVTVKTPSGRAGKGSLATASEGAEIAVSLVGSVRRKELVIDAPHLDLVRASIHDRTGLRPTPHLRRSADGLFRLQLPMQTYSLDVHAASGPGIRIRLLDAENPSLPRLVLSERALQQSALRLIDERGQPLVGEHATLKPTDSMRTSAGPYVPRVTPDGAFEVTWHNQLHGTSDSDGRVRVLAPTGDYEVSLLDTGTALSLLGRAVVEPPNGVVTLSPGREVTLTFESRRSITLRLHVSDRSPGEPRRFEIGLQGESFPEQLSGDRVVVEIGTAACTLVVALPGQGRAATVEVPPGQNDMALDVDL